MTHQKRLATSRHWPIQRKQLKFVTCPVPGSHKKTESVPLNFVLRDMLSVTKTTREAKKILQAKQVLIDGVVKKDHRFPVGFMDVIAFPETKEQYVLIYNDVGKLALKKYDAKNKKPYQIINKTMLKGKKLQLNLFNGKNVLVEKGKEYKVGDSVIIEKNKVTKHLKFEKGQNIFLTGGKHIGAQGVLEGVKKQGASNKNAVVIKTKNGTFETLKKYAFVTGEMI